MYSESAQNVSEGPLSEYCRVKSEKTRFLSEESGDVLAIVFC